MTSQRAKEHHRMWGKRECESQSGKKAAVGCCLWNVMAVACTYVPAAAVVTCKRINSVSNPITNQEGTNEALPLVKKQLVIDGFLEEDHLSLGVGPLVGYPDSCVWH